MSPEMKKMLKAHDRFSRSGLSTRGKRLKLARNLDVATTNVCGIVRREVDRGVPANRAELERLTSASNWAVVTPPPPVHRLAREVSTYFTEQIRELGRRPLALAEDAPTTAPRNRKKKKAVKRALRSSLTLFVLEVNSVVASRDRDPGA